MKKLFYVLSALLLSGGLFSLNGCGSGSCGNGSIQTSQYGCVSQGSCAAGSYSTSAGCLTSSQLGVTGGVSCPNTSYLPTSINGVTECCLNGNAASGACTAAITGGTGTCPNPQYPQAAQATTPVTIPTTGQQACCLPQFATVVQSGQIPSYQLLSNYCVPSTTTGTTQIPYL